MPKESVLTIGKQTATYLHERQQQSSLRLESEMEDSWEFPIDSAKLMGQEILEGFQGNISLSLALPGVGLPQDIYTKAVNTL